MQNEDGDDNFIDKIGLSEFLFIMVRRTATYLSQTRIIHLELCGILSYSLPSSSNH